MNSFAAILALGFVLGMRHATDPDHVIAVTTIVARQRKTGSAAFIGALWGIGHTLTILLVGSGIILFRWVISPRLGLSMEFAVALMLIVLGILNVTGVLGKIAETPDSSEDPHAAHAGTQHAHHHAHGDYVHRHQHSHEPEAHPHTPDQTPVAWLDRQLGALGVYQSVRPLVVGVIHGLAGSAAVALLVLATISDPRYSMFYLLVFGLGTIVGMMLTTAVIALPFRYAAARSATWTHGLRVVSGLLSLGFGLFIAYRIGIVQGLFGGKPEWTPR